MAAHDSSIQFQACLSRPRGKDKGADWLFLSLPQDVSDRLPARGMVSVEGTFDGTPFAATLEPDGNGGHWLRIKPPLQKAVGAQAGAVASLAIAPAAVEPEPEVPDDFQQALDTAPPKAVETWQAITPMARRDYIHWMVSGKKAETRVKRIETAVSKLAAGNRRPCCFDRSGMYGKSLSCPIADDED